MAKGRIRRSLKAVASGFHQGWGTIAKLLRPQAKGAIGKEDWATQIEKYTGTPYACIRKKAVAVAAVPFRLFKVKSTGNHRRMKDIEIFDVTGDSISQEEHAYMARMPHVQRFIRANKAVEIEEVAEHPSLDLLGKVNDKMTRFNLFDLLVTSLELTGNCYWLLDKEKSPTKLWILPTQYIKIKQGEGIGEVEEYIYKPNSKEIKYPPERIIHHWYPGPFSQIYGYSPIVAASRPINVEDNIFKYQEAMFDNMGVIPAMIVSEGRVGKEEKERFEQRWREKTHGADNWWNIPLLLEGKMRLEKVGIVPQEMGFLDGAKMAREWICNDLQVPLSKLTMESSNRAVSERGDIEFQRDSIQPICIMIAEELTESLAPRYGDGLVFIPDNPVPEDQRQKLSERKTNLSVPYSTPDEERAKEGLEPVPGGDQIWVPMGMVPLGSAPQIQPGITEDQMNDMIDKAMQLAEKRIRERWGKQNM